MNRLQRGDFFGETALLTGERRNATIVAAEKVEVYALGKSDFDAVIMASAPLEEELRKATLRPSLSGGNLRLAIPAWATAGTRQPIAALVCQKSLRLL